MASKTYEMVYKLGAKLNNNYGKTFEKAENIASRSMKKIASLVMATVATLSIASFTVNATNEFMAFEESMNEVFTLLPGISSKAMEEMTDQVKEASLAMGTLPEETVPALYQALSAGVSQDNVFAFLEQANKAAVGGVSTLETSVDGLTTVVNSYGSDVIDVGKASDLMFTAVKEGKTTFDEMAGSLFNVLPTAAASGVAFEDVTAAIATLTSQGVPTSVATTMISKAIEELSDSGGDVGKTFEKVSGKSFKTFIAEGGNMQKAMQLLEKEAYNTNQGVNELFGSSEAGNAVLALTGKGTEKFSKSLEAMANSAGATDAAFEQMNTGLKDVIDDLKVRFAVFKLDVGEGVAVALSKVLEIADKLGSYFSDVFTGILENNDIKFIMMKCYIDDIKYSLSNLFDVITSDVGPAFVDIANKVAPIVIESLVTLLRKSRDFIEFTTENWSTIAPILKTVAVGYAAINIAGLTVILIKNTAKLIINTKAWVSNTTAKIADKTETIAIKALYAKDMVVSMGKSTIALAKNTGAWVANKAQLIAQKVGLIALKGVQLVSTGVTTAMTVAQWALNAAFIASPIGWVVLAIGALIAVGVLLYKNWDTIKVKTFELWASFQTFIAGVVERFPVVGQVIEFVFGYISAQVDNVKLIVSGIIDFIGGVFSGDWERAWQGITDIFGGIFGGIAEIAKVPINAISGMLNAVIDRINNMNIEIPDWVPGMGGKTFSIDIPKLPMFAKGTDNSPSTFIAGEAGAEIVTNREHSKVFTAFETGNILNNIAKLENVLNKIASKTGDGNVDEIGIDDNNNNNNNGGGVSLLKTKSSGDSGSSKIEINYSPTIHVDGGGNVDDIKSMIESLLAKDKVDLVGIVKQVMQQEKERNVRLSNG